jgi:hypothetical protein
LALQLGVQKRGRGEFDTHTHTLGHFFAPDHVNLGQIAESLIAPGTLAAGNRFVIDFVALLTRQPQHAREGGRDEETGAGK